MRSSSLGNEDRMIAVFDGREAAVLVRRRPSQDVWLSYDRDYEALMSAVPLSASAPLGCSPHEVSHWIDGLLPDNSDIRLRWCQDAGAASPTAFDLLSTESGLECAGAFAFCPASRFGQLSKRPSGLMPLTEEQVAAKLRALHRNRWDWHSNGIGDDAARNPFSLSGGQPKIALRMDQGRWHRPDGDEPTTHILKPSVRSDYPDMDIVEHLTMATARRLGLPAARTECLHIGDERTLLVHRYDRETTVDGVLRVHQEDMCQALGMWPRCKYQAHGGPSPKQIAALLGQRSAAVEEDLERFRDALLYNWLIVGTDAHGKNYSLLYHQSGARLAPLYDTISLLPYTERSQPSPHVNLSMATGEDFSLAAADRPEYWEAMSDQIGVTASGTAASAQRLADDAPGALSDEIDLLCPRHRASRFVGLFHERLRERAAGLRRSISKAP